VKSIKLTKGMEAIIDDDDFDLVNAFKWHFSTRGYAHSTDRSGIKRRCLKMHRLIMNAPAGMDIDHINGNKLDNRRCNLRICTRSENMFNRPKNRLNKSGYKGVCWSNYLGKWKSSISCNGVVYHIGVFDDPKVAYDAYCAKAKELHGEFAFMSAEVGR